MPTYVYGCKNCDNREVVVHGMFATVVVVCGVCGEWMHKIPQVFRWGFSSNDILFDHMDKKFNDYKKRKRKRGKK